MNFQFYTRKFLSLTKSVTDWSTVLITLILCSGFFFKVNLWLKYIDGQQRFSSMAKYEIELKWIAYSLD